MVGCEAPSTNPSNDAAATRAVAVADAFVEAITRSDTVSLRLHSLPQMTLTALSDDPSEPPRVTGLDGFLRQVQADSGRFIERLWSPQALVDDRLATVWSPYDFYRDGEFSHCGIDAFHLVRMGSSWKVASVAYTVHPENCAESPLGPPT